MPYIHTPDGQTITCRMGENLRRVLMRHRWPLYNSPAQWIHCRGLGTCGTCAIQIVGKVSEATPVERWRLGFPPHRPERGLRLACQCRVWGDLHIRKFGGLWGTEMD
ncbi:MAG: 2Fe-2S iron-sulfur cluster-binding protein [Bernardetiaceae bacterium]